MAANVSHGMGPGTSRMRYPSFIVKAGERISHGKGCGVDCLPMIARYWRHAALRASTPINGARSATRQNLQQGRLNGGSMGKSEARRGRDAGAGGDVSPALQPVG